MSLKDIEVQNAATLQALRKNPGSVDPAAFPFYGYYDVDIFECPPFVMFTNNDCPRAENILYERYFEPMSMKLWCRLARTATGILDLGAHVGVYSLAAAALRPDIEIHAYEPNPHAYTRLRMHKIINGFKNIVEHPIAAGNQEGFVRFSWVIKNRPQISSGASVTDEVANREQVAVPIEMLDRTPLSATLGSRPLIKIDVEGGEMNAFNGMWSVINLKPDIILETFSEEACALINAKILPMGYKIFHILERAGTLQQCDMLRPCRLESLNFNHLLTMRSAEEVAALAA